MTQQLAQTFGHLIYLWEIYKKHVFWCFLTLQVWIWSQIAEKFSSSWDIKFVVFVCLQLYGGNSRRSITCAKGFFQQWTWCYALLWSNTISDWEFETFWPFAKFHHNCYTPGLQILCSCVYISHEHEYIFYFFIVQLWKLTEASWSLKVIVSGDWNGCHVKVTSNLQIPPFGECGLCMCTSGYHFYHNTKAYAWR